MHAWLIANLTMVTFVGAIVTVALCIVLYGLQPPQTRTLASLSVPPRTLKVMIVVVVVVTVLSGTIAVLWAYPETHDKDVAVLKKKISLGDGVWLNAFLPAGLTPTDENSFLATMTVTTPMHPTGHCAYHSGDFVPALYVSGADVSVPALQIDKLPATESCKMSWSWSLGPKHGGKLTGLFALQFLPGGRIPRFRTVPVAIDVIHIMPEEAKITIFVTVAIAVLSATIALSKK